MKEILEGIREYNGMSEDEFYTQLIEEGDKWDYGTYRIYDLIVDGLESNFLTDCYMEDIVKLSNINKVFSMETGKDIEDVFYDEKLDYEKFQDDLGKALLVLQQSGVEIEEDEVHYDFV